MRNTHFVIDQSASMTDIDQALRRGLREMMLELPAQSTVTVTRFNHEVVVGKRESVQGVALETGVCRGTTALYDAIDAALETELADPLAETHLVVFTDGLDNASRVAPADVAAKIEEAREQRGWVVSFLGCNQDAVLTATRLGIDPDRALTCECSGDGVRSACRALSANVGGDSVEAFTRVQRQASMPARVSAASMPEPSFLAPPRVCRQKTERGLNGRGT